MGSKDHLRPVAEGETAPSKPKPATVTEAITVDDRATFIAMQERIAKAIDDPNIRGADLASLTRRLHELRKEVEAIDARAAEADDDEAVEDEAFDPAAI